MLESLEAFFVEKLDLQIQWSDSSHVILVICEILEKKFEVIIFQRNNKIPSAILQSGAWEGRVYTNLTPTLKVKMPILIDPIEGISLKEKKKNGKKGGMYYVLHSAVIIGTLYITNGTLF